jgi:hypothetical protein
MRERMLLIYGNRKVGGMRQNNATGKLRMAPMRELPVVQSNRAAQVGRSPSAFRKRKCVGRIKIRRYELPNWRVAPSAPTRPTWAAKQRLRRCSPEGRLTMLTLSFVVHDPTETLPHYVCRGRSVRRNAFSKRRLALDSPHLVPV